MVAAEKPSFSAEELVRWAEASVRSRANLLGRGYQAALYLNRETQPPLVVKAATGIAPVRAFRAFMLRREHRAYARLDGVAGVPHCFGLLAGRYLVLEYVEGISRKDAEICDREAFFAELLALIREVHGRGVAHGDIQKRDNLLVVDGRHPCVLDFGASVVRRDGASPLNGWLFRFLTRLDLNTWVKLKYRGRIEEASPADLALYRRTWLEKAARSVKRTYTAPRRWWRRFRGR